MTVRLKLKNLLKIVYQSPSDSLYKMSAMELMVNSSRAFALGCQLSNPCKNLINKPARRGGASSNSHPFHGRKTFGFDLFRCFNMPGPRLNFTTDRCKTGGIGAGMTTDNKHQVNVQGNFTSLVLPNRSGITDGIVDSQLLAFGQADIHDVLQVFIQLSGLRDDPDFLHTRQCQCLLSICNDMNQGFACVRDNPLNFRVFHLTDNDNRITFIAESSGVLLSFFDKWTGRINNGQVALMDFLHLFRGNPVRAHNH